MFRGFWPVLQLTLGGGVMQRPTLTLVNNGTTKSGHSDVLFTPREFSYTFVNLLFQHIVVSFRTIWGSYQWAPPEPIVN